MKLYTTAGAPNPARVHFFLAEKGIRIETVAVNLMKGEHKTAEYRAKVPNGRVPALELDSGEVLCESPVICRYLEHLHPEPNLCGSDALEQARIAMWERIVEFELMLPMAMCFRHTHPAMAALEQQVPEYGERQRTVAESRIRRLDRELGDRPYIAGERFTVADITAWCTLRFFRVAGFTCGEELANLRRWMDAVSSRPGAAASTLR